MSSGGCAFNQGGAPDLASNGYMIYRFPVQQLPKPFKFHFSPMDVLLGHPTLGGFLPDLKGPIWMAPTGGSQATPPVLFD